MNFRNSRLGAVAARLWQVAAFTVVGVCTAAVPGPTGSLVDAAGRLQIDVHFNCAIAPPVAALSAAGLSVSSSVHAGTFCVVEGWALPAALPQIDTVPGVIRVTAPSYVNPPSPRALGPMLQGIEHALVRRQGTSIAIDQNGITIMRADQFITQTGVTGAGITVGVQSSGVYSLSTIQARGELPAVQVVYPASGPTQVQADEGTALLEEVHAVAPGAKLVYCGPQTFVDYTSCLTQMANAGATILLDDIGNISDGLLQQDNDQTTAIESFLTQNPTVMMLSSAGNNNGTYWEGDYAPVATPSPLQPLSCPSGSGTPDAYVATFNGATSETLTLFGDATFPLLLAWADPPGQITSDFDVFWFAPGSTTPVGCFSTAGATTDQVMQYVSLASSASLPAGTAYTLVVASPDASNAGKFLKLWAGGDGLTGFSAATTGGLVSPQAMVPGLLIAGAVDGADGIGDTIEAYSSSGPLKVIYPAPASLQAPTLVAPDGINVDAAGTYFASYLFPDGNFYGTSAAVPNAGAVAALLSSAFPTLSVAQISMALENGATVLDATPTPNNVYGYGRVDALGALGTLPVPTITALANQLSVGSATTTAQALTVSGTGPLHFTASSSNAALVPGTIVAAGTPGITLSSGCGTVTLNCTVSVTPVRGQAGAATVTISVLDGANRPAVTMMTLSATDPAPATVSSASPPPTSSGGNSGGGALQSWVLLWLGAVLAWALRRRREGFTPA
jgi:MYXO-CTERM domain-containing protein